MSARSRRDGAHPGAFTSVRLSAGTYEVTYWAQADVGERARVGGHLGGVDLRRQSVGDEWQQFTERVDVDEPGAASNLKLWVETTNVRVLFDDVQVRLIAARRE